MLESDKSVDIEVAKLQLEMWKVSVGVTQHFNELSHKTRQTGFTAVAGAVALAFALITQYPSAKLSVMHGEYQYEAHISTFILLMAAAGVYVTRLLDIRFHHRMLRGSVAFTQAVEEAMPLKSAMGVKRGLAASISFHSRSRTVVSDDDAEMPAKKTSAEAKLRRVYGLALWGTLLASVFVFWGSYSATLHETVRINQTIEMKRR